MILSVPQGAQTKFGLQPFQNDFEQEQTGEQRLAEIHFVEHFVAHFWKKGDSTKWPTKQ